MADRSRSRKQERVLHNWRRVFLSAMSQPSSRPGRLNSDLPDSVPTSLPQASTINTILQVANEIQHEAPNVSRILCEYAYSLSQSLDPNSEKRGVLQFKTGLIAVIKQKLAKKDGTTFDRWQDIATVEKFYNDYREKHHLDDLQGDGGVDSVEFQDAQLRSRVYTVLRVLKDCVYALARDSSIDPDTIIPPKLKKDMESDAKKSEAFQPYNILPLEARGVFDAILNFPEVIAARLALQFPALHFSNELSSPPQKWDVFDALKLAFGFQHDNVRNQREHLVLLLANGQFQLGSMPGPPGQGLDLKVIHELCNRLLGNYDKWCHYIRKEPVHKRRNSSEEEVAFMSLYLLIWGEAANVRFLPEALCYIFHNMATEFALMLDNKCVEVSVSCKTDNGQSFLDQIITPLYIALKAEASRSNGGRSGHSKWRNYDDFNEFFWSYSCFKELGWPMNYKSPFFGNSMDVQGSRGRRLGKTSFVEHRTFLHLYHSFLRTWILLVLMFQALTIIAFTKFSRQGLKILLSLGLTYFVMKLIESGLDIILMVGAYTSSRGNAITRIFSQFLFFGGCTGGFFFLYLKMMLEDNARSTYFNIYLLALGVYVALQLIISFFLHIPALRKQAEKSDRIKCFEAVKWLYQERYFVGRGLFERPRDYLRYVIFWIVVLGCKFTFSFFLQIKPLVDATTAITSLEVEIVYEWHDFFSKNNHNALAILFLWAPVLVIYLLDISIWYTIISAIWGGLLGARDRLGEIRSLEMLRNRFESFPEGFVNSMEHERLNELGIESPQEKVQRSAKQFAPFWNEIITCLRSEDYITNREKDLLLMPSNTAGLPLVQWPLFLLVSKVFLAMDLAMEKKESSEEIWEKLGKDQYMASAVREVFESVCMLLTDLVDGEGGKWFQRVFEDVNRSVIDKSFFAYFQINNIQDVVKKITALTGLLKSNNEGGVASAVQGLYEAVYNFLSDRSRDSYPKLSPADVRIKFGSVRLPKDDRKEAIKRLHSLLTIKESAATVPKNLEARRRLEFFTNSLFMKMPVPPTVRAMKSFSVYTPYYEEIVMYSKEELREDNEDGISTLFYLQKIFPDEWKNFLERIGLIEVTFDNQLKSGTLDPENLLKLRLWASYRGQTLARTVRGMMYYRRALMLQSFLEAGGKESWSEPASFDKSRQAKACADLKFTYVITCQKFGHQKAKKEAKANDILYLMKENEALRIAYIDEVESETGKGEKNYFSKLVKNDSGALKDQEIYSIKLPGNPILGEGKPENQNHAVIFTRGDAIQTIDMNQDNYFEEALKMRNLLQEFEGDYGLRAPTILGVREHVFTGSVSSLAWFMSNQETSFVTLGQRVLARPLKVRMHYGHPDVFDRLFHLTRGGFSKASKVINISEDIYAGFNSTLRQGNVTHHEYIQVGKGRDVGLNQIAMFEAKVSSGNGEQSLSRDVYRLGQLLDFFRMLSFYATSVGYYVCTMMTVLVVYVFLYGKAYLALSGVGRALEEEAVIMNNRALQSALDTQFLFQIGVFTAIPMLMGFILEQGVLKAIVSFITMQLQLCSVFFTFSLGTRTHYFGRTILHGGAKYRSTGRGFVVTHVKFAENYRLYSRSHFVKALEIAMLLIVYLAYGFEDSTTSYILLSFSSWFLALSWLFAPYIFNPSGFEWQKTVDDLDDWMGWLLYRGGVGVKSEESWEAWWEEEQGHIRHNRGRILETILSLRFFFFQYGVVYQLKAVDQNTSLTVYGLSWLVLVGVVLISKVFSFNSKASVRFQMLLRFIQGSLFISLIGALVAVVAVTSLTVGDVFASLLALIPTGWGILSIGIAWKGRVKALGLWSSFRAIARFYDAAMGMVIFLPIAFLSWFPFVSTFQTRLLFNQAFSRGLEISLILAGNRPNAQT
ncbi:hypothetical protein GOP47_0025325 [Adiantum capillus-veneris]|uniref:1,3-beta-glucan synthase n=1 Tax=Adiantum capillus-veneris TaxID=13818 RepID=A0A9D4Z403_ADICA|nr:hypothetical protein GOP47_0025325 [Adiantum capillus-veneris]